MVIVPVLGLCMSLTGAVLMWIAEDPKSRQRPVGAVMVAVGSATQLVAAMALDGEGRNIDWGSAGEWVSGSAAALAIAATIMLTRSERRRSQSNIDAERQEQSKDRDLTQRAIEQTDRSLELERQRWEVDLAAREQWQAKLVSTWFSITKIGAGGRPLVFLGVANGSAVPVTEVRAFTLFQGIAQRADGKGATLKPGEPTNVRMSPSNHEALTQHPDCYGITFRDAGGTYWARYCTGQLIRLGLDNDADLLKRPWRQ